MKKHHTTLCPFIKKEQVKVDTANYFRVNRFLKNDQI